MSVPSPLSRAAHADDLSAIFHLSSVGMAVADPVSRRYLRVNAALCELTGYSEAELLRMTVDELNHPDDRDEDRHAYAQILRGERPYDREKRYRRKDGTPLWVHVTGNLLRSDDGAPIRAISVVVDISRRKAAEEALRERTALMRAVSEHTSELVFVKDRQSRLMYANPATLQLLGLTEETATGNDLTTVIADAAQAEAILANDRRIMESGIPEAVEEVVTTPGGTRIFQSTKAPMRDDAGQVIGLIGIASDITDRKRDEDRIRELNAQLQEQITEFQTLLDILPVGVWQADAACERIIGNAAGYRMFGIAPGTNASLTSSQDPFRGIRCFANGRELAAEELPLQRVARTGLSLNNFEHDVVFDDGRAVTVHSNVAPLLNADGSVRGVVGVSVDLSERKRQEEALREADRRKDEFLAILAHELRNPLAPIRTGLELLRLRPDKAVAVDELRPMLERQVAHMVRLIDDLLEVSRITSGRIQLQRQPSSPVDLIHQAVEANRATLQNAGVGLEVHLTDLPYVLDVDPTRIVQVISNVLHNAAKFTPAGGLVRVTALAEQRAATQADIVISVSDTGEGIAPRVLPHIFELFVQGESGHAKSEGLGIGLALARRLVEMHAGTIEARSEGRGRGSTFTIRIPAVPNLPEASSALATEAEPPVISKRVLVVDDNVDAADMLALLVRVLGGEVLTAYDGEACLRDAQRFAPDVILLDVGMPHMDGYEVCRRLRGLAFDKPPLIVALTGWGQEIADAPRRRGSTGISRSLPIPPPSQRCLRTPDGRGTARDQKRQSSPRIGNTPCCSDVLTMLARRSQE